MEDKAQIERSDNEYLREFFAEEECWNIEELKGIYKDKLVYSKIVVCWRGFQF